MKKSEIRKLDTQWSLKVKEKAGFKCESCLESGIHIRLESAHIVGRVYRTTRWGCWIEGLYDLNGMCLCSACHQQYDDHRPKEIFIRRVVIGEERYEKLCQQKQVIAKNQDYEEIKKWIKEA